jgi:hypothetical protein
LVTGGFFEIDQSMYQQPTAVVGAVWHGVRRLNGNVMTMLGVIGLIAVLVSIVRTRHVSHLLVVLSLAACGALPLYAFWNGHPFRIRLAAMIVVLTALVETPPLSGHSPMVVEAQRDAASVVARRAVTECPLQNYDQTPILASMGSLAPYMQETARAGLAIRQFLHEGSVRCGPTASLRRAAT